MTSYAIPDESEVVSRWNHEQPLPAGRSVQDDYHEVVKAVPSAYLELVKDQGRHWQRFSRSLAPELWIAVVTDNPEERFARRHVAFAVTGESGAVVERQANVRRVEKALTALNKELARLNAGPTRWQRLRWRMFKKL